MYVLLTQLFCILAFVSYVTFSYKQKKVSLIVTLVTITTWFCAGGSIVLLQFDIQLVFLSIQSLKRIKTYDTILFYTWVTVYALSLLLSWTVIPILTYYYESGHFSRSQRLFQAFKQLLTFYLIFGIIGVILTGFFLYFGVFDSFSNLIITMTSLAYIWGQSILAVTMGYNIIRKPKDFLHQRETKQILKSLYLAALKKWEQLQIQTEKLDSSVKLVYYYKKEGMGGDVIDLIVDKNRYNEDICYVQTLINYQDRKENKVDFVDLNASVQFEVENFFRVKILYEHIIEKALFYEDTLENVKNRHKIIVSNIRPAPNYKHIFETLTKNFEWFWYTKIQRWAIVFSLLCMAFWSIMIYTNQILFVTNSEFSLLGQILEQEQLNNLVIQLLITAQTVYVSYLVYSGLFSVKIFGWYGMYPYNQTDASSLLFASNNFLRVVPPLCNFFLQITGIKRTVFAEIYGITNIPLLGGWRNILFFSFQTMISLVALFDVRLKVRSLGCYERLFGKDDALLREREGEKLVKLQRKQQHEKINKQIFDEFDFFLRENNDLFM